MVPIFQSTMVRVIVFAGFVRKSVLFAVFTFRVMIYYSSSDYCRDNCLQRFDVVGWAAGRASDL